MANVTMDSTNAVALNQVLETLSVTMNTDVHANAASGAAFAILEKQFGVETDAMAYVNDSEFTHVYEWDEVGSPTGRLFQAVINGRGKERMVTWNWLPSKTIVPINPDDYPIGFDTSRLSEHHVFVWKAPVMEYGNVVHVSRKNSPVLVIPFPDSHSQLYDSPGQYYSDGNNSVLITKRSYTFSPGSSAGVVGNFTAWFRQWWGAGRAQTILSDIFDPVQSSTFKKHFEAQTAGLTGKATNKTINFSIVSAKAKGTKIAEKIAQGIAEDYASLAKRQGGWSL